MFILFSKIIKLLIREITPPIIFRILKSFKFNILKKGSTGNNNLDLAIIKFIKPNTNGYFVELGANDGISQSNTYKLQKEYKWGGILIEPNQKKFIDCIDNRSFNNKPKFFCNACVPFDFKNKFVEIEYSNLMSVAKGLNIDNVSAIEHANRGVKFLEDASYRHTSGAIAKTLTKILEEANAPCKFDLLSLDVEGNELSVLKGIDFTKYLPKWIVVETRDKSIEDFLRKFNYSVFQVLNNYDSYHDILFKHDGYKICINKIK